MEHELLGKCFLAAQAHLTPTECSTLATAGTSLTSKLTSWVAALSITPPSETSLVVALLEVGTYKNLLFSFVAAPRI